METGEDCDAFETARDEPVAVFTITALRRADLHRFADAIFFDVATVRKSLECATVLIILLTESNETMSATRLFAAFNTREIFERFRGKLVEILQDQFRIFVTDKGCVVSASAVNLEILFPLVLMGYLLSMNGHISVHKCKLLLEMQKFRTKRRDFLRKLLT
jgi:hypothetical protein